ncbi:uncharacterized protein LOC127875106 [Dreissena polymorpha]|uniref:RING-type domain-containing protein n=1 Tax=Dreissena polymorpha TaxID=45954 RepID=A0A9D4R3I6_DREPO|nr:uncharacterized protein LOC127875106 [Dreissena polymorpha]KAH3852883.1 hypothetical protein DPMN_095404 [Dreissena polymorpha]
MKRTELEDFQETYEQRFGCCICLGPRLHMVSGQCQHRICVDCLYVEDERRPCMEACPICSMFDSFPKTRPIIPTQVIDVQKCLGVSVCQSGCGLELWYWETDEHERSCPAAGNVKPVRAVQQSPHRRSRVNDIGRVSVTARTRVPACKRVTRSKSVRSTRPRYGPM